MLPPACRRAGSQPPGSPRRALTPSRRSGRALTPHVTPKSRTPGRSGEDDLAARGQGVELADRDDALDLLDEVVLGDAEQVAGGLAAVKTGAAVGDQHDLGPFRERGI